MNEPTNRPVWWGPAVPHAVPSRDTSTAGSGSAFASSAPAPQIARIATTPDELPPVIAPMLTEDSPATVIEPVVAREVPVDVPPSFDTDLGAFAPAPTTSAFAAAITSFLAPTGDPIALPVEVPGEVAPVESWEAEAFGSAVLEPAELAPLSVEVAHVESVDVDVIHVEVLDVDEVDVEDVHVESADVDDLEDESVGVDDSESSDVADVDVETTALVDDDGVEIDESGDVEPLHIDALANEDVHSETDVAEVAATEPPHAEDFIEHFDDSFAAVTDQSFLPETESDAATFDAPQPVTLDSADVAASESVIDLDDVEVEHVRAEALEPEAVEVVRDEVDDEPLPDSWAAASAAFGAGGFEAPVPVLHEGAPIDAPIDDDFDPSQFEPSLLGGTVDFVQVDEAEGEASEIDHAALHAVPDLDDSADDAESLTLPLPVGEPLHVDLPELPAQYTYHEATEADAPLHVDAPALATEYIQHDVAADDEPLHLVAAESVDVDALAEAVPHLADESHEPIADADGHATFDVASDIPAIVPALVPALQPRHDIAHDEQDDAQVRASEPRFDPLAFPPPASSLDAVAMANDAHDESATAAGAVPPGGTFHTVGVDPLDEHHNDRSYAPTVGGFAPGSAIAAPLSAGVFAGAGASDDNVDTTLSSVAPAFGQEAPEFGRDFAPAVTAFGFGGAAVPYETAFDDVHRPEPSERKPGDVENGYVLNDNYHWVPAEAPMSVGPLPAMWLDDPMVPGQRRYWDGQAWTEAVAEASAQPAGAEFAMAGAPTSSAAANVAAHSSRGGSQGRPTKPMNSFTSAASYAGTGGGSSWGGAAAMPVYTSVQPKQKMSSGLKALLIVMSILGGFAIIAVLAAVAVPVFFSQRQKAMDTAVVSEVTNVSLGMNAYYRKHHQFPKNATQLASTDAPLAMASGDKVFVVTDGKSGFCVAGYSVLGHYTVKSPKLYDSKSGGMQPDGTRTCKTKWNSQILLP